MPEPSHPLRPGDRVKLNAAGEQRYDSRKGQSGTVDRWSVAAPTLVYVRWQSGTVSCHLAECLERDEE